MMNGIAQTDKIVSYSRTNRPYNTILTLEQLQILCYITKIQDISF